jgi:putative nucleotidyltransferase with HDIG domain
MTNLAQFDFIKEETRKRCKIFALDASAEKKFVRVNVELFHYLYEVSQVDFAIYFRIENTMIEFIKKEEFSRELLDKIWGAIEASRRQIQICILKVERPKLNKIIEDVRNKKIRTLLEKDPHLDRKTLEIFSNLSNASQMIVRGGINNEVASQVKASAAYLVNNLLDSESAVVTLSRMVIHDPTLYDHSAAVAMLAGVIAKTCVPNRIFSPREVEVVAQCGLYHDVGKTCVPSAVLNKPGKFTDDEYSVMKTHATLGEKELKEVIVAGAPIDELAARVAGEHHERFFGGGYPSGRQGRFEEDPKNGIHVYTRVVTIADVYSALLMKRVYKPAYQAQDAIKIMADVAPKEYDPEIFPKFLQSVIASLNTYQEKHAKKDKGRILFMDENGKLRERDRKVV